MNTAPTTTLFQPFQNLPEAEGKELFRERFQRSLRGCLQRGFCVEESFGMIWMEVWEEVQVSEEEQGELYEELIQWAKSVLR